LKTIFNIKRSLRTVDLPGFVHAVRLNAVAKSRLTCFGAPRVHGIRQVASRPGLILLS